MKPQKQMTFILAASDYVVGPRKVVNDVSVRKYGTRCVMKFQLADRSVCVVQLPPRMAVYVGSLLTLKGVEANGF
ncbi:MAG: hypothetical protein AAGJ40_22030 [Planctomycetota bacterium]